MKQRTEFMKNRILTKPMPYNNIKTKGKNFISKKYILVFAKKKKKKKSRHLLFRISSPEMKVQYVTKKIKS